MDSSFRTAVAAARDLGLPVDFEDRPAAYALPGEWLHAGEYNTRY